MTDTATPLPAMALDPPQSSPVHPQTGSLPTSPTTGYAVELYFDPALENQVLKSWNVLARRQLSTHLIDISARPHLTLLSFPASSSSLDPLRLLSPLRSLAARLDPVPISLSSISSFPDTGTGAGTGTLFFAPVPTAPLLGLHAQLCELIKKEGVEPPEGYRADAWVPSCAVAMEVPKTRLAEAFCVLRDMKLPVSGYGMDIGLVEFPPVREIFSFPLGGGSDA
ncbi:RNA ligase/cyclic nucleotide phosphodiesterase [Rhynchospora pubera]|uniref:RNA ligase/cyclic nucleotide phosphodiesterase n=2 Tax=Rhynchospora pubera TaxID=906938 RepID=A0AAV8G158_9POAL|nr:RNA ligase/cyclic nucleotide phosphodiesterase [Rhynchospora pubera]KAJ4799318.1 RNA ligase/cyclic nucleotide phosphodiesterase [Rhynchospora pubera]